MNEMEQQIFEFLKEEYVEEMKDYEDSASGTSGISLFYQGMINGINLCVEKLNCKVSEDFKTKCNGLLDEMIEAANKLCEDIK